MNGKSSYFVALHRFYFSLFPIKNIGCCPKKGGQPLGSIGLSQFIYPSFTIFRCMVRNTYIK